MSAAEKMEPFKFRERPSIIKKAQRIADKREENFSEILREAVRSYVRKHARELEDEN